jgi:hypothetical protein
MLSEAPLHSHAATDLAEAFHLKDIEVSSPHPSHFIKWTENKDAGRRWARKGAEGEKTA